MKTPKNRLLIPIGYNRLNFFISCLIAVFSSLSIHAQVPIINSVIPSSAPIGSTVSIQGNNFNSNINGNTVFFGAVKATVVSASSSTLSVIVPDGATYQPISITSNGLTGYSPQPFVVTFPGSFLTRNAFTSSTKYNTGYYPDGIVAVDLDGDGKVDLATANNGNKPYSTFSVLRNISLNGQVNFAPNLEFKSDTMPHGISAADLDGDGKQDLIITSINNSFSIYRNTSTIGSISFDPEKNYAASQLPETIAIGDLNGDGKPDVIISNSIGVTITVYLNTSTPGTISLKQQADLISGISPTKVCLADLDGDGKLDIAVTNNLDNSISVFRNTSTLSAISFTTKTDYKVSYGPQGIAAGDLDGDGKPDLAVVNGNDETVSLFKNTSTLGSISFYQYSNFSITSYPTTTAYNVSISDLDGDGKPDLAIATYDHLVTLKNQSKTGTISFGNYNETYNYGETDLAISDLDGDGKPDIAITNSITNNVSVYKNTSDAPVYYSISPLSAPAGAKVIITGLNFNDITDISFGGVSASSFTQIASDTIVAIVGNGASGNVTLTTKHGVAYWYGFIFQGPPLINSITPDSGAIGSTITIRGNNFTSVSTVTFGGTPAQYFIVDSPSVIRARVALGSSGYVQVKNIYGSDSLNGFFFIPPPHIKSFSPKVAQQDSFVIIKGDGFSNASAISFGGTDASSFTVINDSTISAKLSNGSSGNILVTTPGGTANKDSFTFIPTVISFSPSRAGFGTAVTIVGKNFTNITGVKFGSYIAYTYKVVSSDTIIATVFNGESGKITIFTNNGSVSIPGFSFIPPPRILSYNPTIAGTGSKITITGVNFSDAQEVRFGNSPALSYIVVNDSTITAIIDNGSSGGVFVRTLGGRDSIGYFKFTTHSIIHSVIPSSGPVGSLVSIQGANFSLNPANNKVYFGAVAAEVINCTSNTIIVKVPFGSTYEPITVATDNYVASSENPFIVTLPTPIKLDSSSFAGKTDFTTGINPGSMAVGDLDGDGKPDIVVLNQKDETISIYKNTSVIGHFSFFRNIDIPSGRNPYEIKLADIDGDGKLYILYINGSTIDSLDPGNFLSVMKNISTSQSIQFKARQKYPTAYNPISLVVADLNSDSKMDVAVLNTGQQLVTIFDNISFNDSIRFSEGEDFHIFQNAREYPIPYSIEVADLNHDGKPDLIMGGLQSPDQIYFINHSFAPGFYFIEKDEREIIGSIYFIHSTDLDLDGWPDIITNENIWHNNKSLYDNIQTEAQKSQQLQGPLAFNDLNGDGWPDYFVVNDQYARNDSSASLFINRSRTGKIIIDSAVKFNLGTAITDVKICDFDGDGNSDIAVANWDKATFSILRNQNGSRAIALCVGSDLSLPVQIQSVSYQWQVNEGKGFTNLSDNNLYTGTISNSLQLLKVPLTANGFQYRCILDTATGPLYTLIISDSTAPYVSIIPLDTILCSQSISGISANSFFGGTNPTYYWMVNGTIKDSTGYLLRSQFQDLDKVQVLMKSNRSCIKTNQAISNVLTLKVVPTIIPKGKASAASTICFDSTFQLLFKAELVPAGTTIQLWQGTDSLHFDSLSSQTYNNQDLIFNYKAYRQGNNWFFFSLNPVPGKCIVPTHTDTIVVNAEYLYEPRFNVINNSFTIMNPDAHLTYTWQILGSGNIWVDIILSNSGYTYTTRVSGYYRLKASSQTCTVYSTQVSLVITAVDPVNNISSGVVIYPNPAITFLHFDSLRISDLWETVEILGVDGLRKLPIMNIRNKASFDLSISALSSGTYLAVLRRKNGIQVQIKFIKL